MKCYVYFLYSTKVKKFYVGISNDITDELRKHTKGNSLKFDGHN